MFTPLAAAAALTFSALTGGAEDPVVRVYDARDLAFAMQRLGGPDGDAPVEPLVEALAEAYNVLSSRVAPGFYALAGESKNIDEWVRVARQFLDANSTTYIVEIGLFNAPAASPPAIGAEVRPEGAFLRSRQSVPRRAETPLNITEETTYIAKWQPVVADSSVGYDATTATVTSGLTANILAGAGDDPASGVRVRLSGLLAKAEVREVSLHLTGHSLPIGLPIVTTRSLHGEAVVSDKPTVLAVVPGFKPDECIVITAAVAPRPAR